MQLIYKESLGLPQGFRVQIFEPAEIVDMAKDPKKLANITNFVNLYLGQKDTLVAGRSDLVHFLETKTSFPREMVESVQDGKTVKEPKLTEAKHIDAFITAAIAGKVKEVKVDLGQNDEQREAAVYTFLQTLANQCGDFTEKGDKVARDKDDWLTAPAFSYKLDVTRPERTSKPKAPPKYALEGASNIIDKGGDKSVAAWKEKLGKGFVAKTGEKITPILFAPFDTKPTNGSTPEIVEAIRQTNLNNLALAIVEIEDQKRAQRSGEYA